MAAGKLKHLVYFDAPVSSADNYGGQVNSFQKQFEAFAGYTRMRGGETVIAARLTGRQPTVLRVRASEETRDVTPEWRVRDARTGEAFNIRSVMETEDRQYIDMMCESGVAI